MTKHYSESPADSKARLLGAANELYAQVANGNVAQQEMGFALIDVIDELQQMNLTRAYQLAKAIDAAEKYVPEADRWGFGPIDVNPVDFLGFLPKDAITDLGELI